MLAVWLRSPLLGRLAHFFSPFFFPLNSPGVDPLSPNYRMFPVLHRLLRVRMLLQSQVCHIVMLQIH